MIKHLRSRSVALGVFALSLIFISTGCKSSSNFYDAEDMPAGLRIASRANPLEANLTQFAAAGRSSDAIRSGDQLKITIIADLDKQDMLRDLPLRVDDRGAVDVPLLGEVQVAGLDPEVVGGQIASQYIRKGIYVQPQVTVFVSKKKMNSVRVVGGVRNPGTYDIDPGTSDVMTAIVTAGGLDPEKAGPNVEIRNPISMGDMYGGGIAPAGYGQEQFVPQMAEPIRINIVQAAQAMGGQYQVQDGAVVSVQVLDPLPITVRGLVNKPQEIPYPIGKDVRLLQALALAGDVTSQVANKVYVIRPIRNSKDPAVIVVSINSAKKSDASNLLLGPGDIVSVEPTCLTVLLDALGFVRFSLSGTQWLR